MYEIGARISTETVMAGIHWGGFMAGGSDAGYLGPSYFMNKGVILVTFNYRLGIFGKFAKNLRTEIQWDLFQGFYPRWMTQHPEIWA